MPGFTDLVLESDPAYYGGGHNTSRAAGRTWRWTWINLTDSAGDPIDLTAATGDCKIVDADRTTDVLELDFTGALGGFTVSADETDTTGLFTGSDYSRGRICYWYLTLTNGTDSIQFWMVDNSPFAIRKGA